MTCSTSPAVGAVGLTLGVVPAHPGAAVARGRSGVVGAVHLFGAVAAAVGTARDLRVVPVRLGLMAAAVVGGFGGGGGVPGWGGVRGCRRISRSGRVRSSLASGCDRTGRSTGD